MLNTAVKPAEMSGDITRGGLFSSNKKQSVSDLFLHQKTQLGFAFINTHFLMEKKIHLVTTLHTGLLKTLSNMQSSKLV